MTAASADTSKDNTDLRQPKTRRKWLRRIGAAFLILLIILFIAIIVLVLNQKLVVESLISRTLSSRGYDSALQLESYSQNHANIKNITLSKDGVVFFKADRLRAQFDFKALQEGQIQNIDLDGAQLWLDVDGQGNIISDWMPPPNPDSTGLPIGSASLKKSTVNVASPYGDLSLAGDAALAQDGKITGDLRLAQTDLTGADLLPGFTARAGGDVDVVMHQGVIDLHSAALRFDTMRYQDSRAENLNVMAKGTITLRNADDNTPLTYLGNIDLSAQDLQLGGVQLSQTKATLSGQVSLSAQKDIHFDGEAAARLARLEHPEFSVQDGVFQYDGAAQFTQDSGLNLSGDVDYKSALTGLSEAARARDLAEAITLSATLANVPVIEQFSEALTNDVASLLRGSAVSGSAKITLNADLRRLDLTAPVRLSQSSRSLTIAGLPQQATYVRQDGQLALAAKIDLRGARSVTLDKMVIRGPAEQGWLWDEVQTVNAAVQTGDMWRSENARLAPLATTIAYDKGKAGQLQVTANVDYDGPLIGMDVTGLRYVGELDVETGGPTVVRAASRGPVEIDAIKTQSGWNAKDIRLTLPDKQTIMTERGGVRDINVTAETLTAFIINPQNGQDGSVTAARAQITGQMSGEAQSWDMTLTEALLTSETTPGPESRVKAPQLSVSLVQSGGGPWGYEIDSPAISIKAKPVTLSEVPLSVSGEGEDMTATYNGGTIKLDGSELPPIPIKGQAQMVDGVITGNATTVLPKASAFPINVDYRYADGQGSAELDVPRFVFTENGLQPHDLAPALKGKVTGVKGIASAKASITYVAGSPMQSSGAVKLEGMDFGTLVGPFTGVKSELNFSSLLPLRTDGEQTIFIGGFDPGIPLGEGVARFSVIEGGFELLEARFPLQDGFISVDPTVWRTDRRKNKVTVRVENISLGSVLGDASDGKIEATGIIKGTLPIVVNGVDVQVEGGRFEIPEGGVIRLKFEEQLADLASKGRMQAMVVELIEEFKYDRMFIEANGPLDGDMRFGVDFTGGNPDVLGGTQFKINARVEGELVNITRNLMQYFDTNKILELVYSEER